MFFTTAQSALAVSVATHFFQIATNGVIGSFSFDDRVRPRKLLLVALRPLCFLHSDLTDFDDLVYFRAYNLAAVIVVKKAVNWTPVSPILAAH